MSGLRQVGSEDYSVVLLTTNSSLAEMFVYDTLKKRAGADLNSILDVNSRATFGQMLELVNIEPNLASKWLFVIDYKKCKGMLKRNPGVLESSSSLFLVKASNYKDFKEFKETYPACNDIYLSMIRYYDTLYLLKDCEISQKLIDYVAKNYVRDVEKVFELKRALEQGIKVESQKDVTAVCGESASTTTRFVFSLLKDMPESEKGLEVVYRNRVRAMEDMLNASGPSRVYRFLLSTVRDMLYIKMLYLSGVVYDSLRDLPDCFDEKKLSRYSPFIERITEKTSYDRLIHLYKDLLACGQWRSKQDAMLFLYQYYIKNVVIEEVS